MSWYEVKRCIDFAFLRVEEEGIYFHSHQLTQRKATVLPLAILPIPPPPARLFAKLFLLNTAAGFSHCSSKQTPKSPQQVSKAQMLPGSQSVLTSQFCTSPQLASVAQDPTPSEFVKQ
ncbi:hypothetical protein B7494_g5973 [Chlorociboria aeruginascens]|nr:hypothetical protein B7494_g5973 [Chlorociboria aeruginascens]